MKDFRHTLIQTIGLSSPKGRLIFLATVTVLVFAAPYDWLAHLSIWQHLGIPSPSIGLTRAYWKLVHLDPVGAWQRNPLIYAVLFCLAIIIISDVRRIRRQKTINATA